LCCAKIPAPATKIINARLRKLCFLNGFSANGSNFTSLGMFPLHGFEAKFVVFSWEMSTNTRTKKNTYIPGSEDTHWIFLGEVKHKKQNDKSEQ
jgi:hypothetical protein